MCLVRLFSLSFPGTAVITDEGKTVSYSELARLTDAWFPEIAPRSLVFLLVGNTLSSLVAYVACLNRGIVPLMLDSEINRELLKKFKDVYRPSHVIDCVTGACENTGSQAVPTAPELALLLTTSGSTGSPKLVRQSYANIRSNTVSIVDYLKLDSTERPITTLPMNYTYGLSIINSHLWVGATILMTGSSVMQREFWTFFAEQAATSFGGVPYTYEMLDRLLFFRRKLPSLRTMTQAGGKLLPELHRKFAEYAAHAGKKFVVMYGQCEATARMSYLPPERALDKVGSMGIAIPGGAFRLIGGDGNEIDAADTVGELIYEGANVTLGYAECAEDLARGDERHGVLMTGDMAKRDADGFYYIVGRKKRFLKIFGNRVNLDETERLIKSRIPGLDCACGGEDDKLKVYVVDGSKTREIIDFVTGVTHLNAAAFEVVRVSVIPKNASGKTLYSQLEGLALR